MSEAALTAVGLIAPGLPDWPTGQAILRGQRVYQTGDLPGFNSQLLPANERRRLSRTSKLALQAAESVLAQCDHKTGIASVFATSSGDGDTIHHICSALTRPDRPVSPTHFHNSVHNAPAGYWSIATHNQAASLSLSAFDSSFSAGLLEAMTMVVAEQQCVLLVAYDYPPPPPLASARPLLAPFAVALLLAPVCQSRSTTLRLRIVADSGPETRMHDPGLEALRTGNPAARCLPLLQSLAGAAKQAVLLPYLNHKLMQITILHDER